MSTSVRVKWWGKIVIIFADIQYLFFLWCLRLFHVGFGRGTYRSNRKKKFRSFSLCSQEIWIRLICQVHCVRLFLCSIPLSCIPGEFKLRLFPRIPFLSECPPWQAAQRWESYISWEFYMFNSSLKICIMSLWNRNVPHFFFKLMKHSMERISKLNVSVRH